MIWWYIPIHRLSEGPRLPDSSRTWYWNGPRGSVGGWAAALTKHLRWPFKQAFQITDVPYIVYVLPVSIYIYTYIMYINICTYILCGNDSIPFFHKGFRERGLFHRNDTRRKINGSNRKIIWTKPPFWGSMLIFRGVYNSLTFIKLGLVLDRWFFAAMRFIITKSLFDEYLECIGNGWEEMQKFT